MKDLRTVLLVVDELLDDGYVDAAKHVLKKSVKETQDSPNKVVMRRKQPELKQPQPPQFEDEV